MSAKRKPSAGHNGNNGNKGKGGKEMVLPSIVHTVDPIEDAENRRVKSYRIVFKTSKGFNFPCLLYYSPQAVTKTAPLVFMVNGFFANSKTWTFHPIREKNKVAPSCAEYLASQGFVVVVKDLEDERVKYERSYNDHCELVGVYANAVFEGISQVFHEVTGKPYEPQGLHWIGHSLGGMVVMGAKDRPHFQSFTAVAAPTYMHLEQPGMLFLVGRLLEMLPLPVPIAKQFFLPANIMEKFLDFSFDRLGIEHQRRLNHDQHLIIGLLLHLPFIREISHIVLNLDHIDFETAAGFVRCGMANENFNLLLDFAKALVKGREGKGEVLGAPIEPLACPTLVIGGEGDDIAPVESVLDLLNYVENPLKENVVFQFYDHLGLLLKYGAVFDVWPIFAIFILEASLKKDASSKEIQETYLRIQKFADNTKHGFRVRGYARQTLERMAKKYKFHLKSLKTAAISKKSA